MKDSRSELGAYGFALQGVDTAAHLLVWAEGWPSLRIRQEIGAPRSHSDRVGDDGAEVALLGGGSVLMDRSPLQALYVVPSQLTSAELVHPFLAIAATIAAYWLGRETFHAGAVVIGDGAWLLVGDRHAGKSSTLAWLAGRGYDVLCDDVAVVADGKVFAGPRAIDLRRSAARALGVGEELGVVGARERWRMALGPVQQDVPLRGWILLDWGNEISISSIRPRTRLGELARQRSIRLPPSDGLTMLHLGALPAYRFARPKEWTSATESGEELLAFIDAHDRLPQ